MKVPGRVSMEHPMCTYGRYMSWWGLGAESQSVKVKVKQSIEKKECYMLLLLCYNVTVHDYMLHVKERYVRTRCYMVQQLLKYI